MVTHSVPCESNAMAEISPGVCMTGLSTIVRAGCPDEHAAASSGADHMMTVTVESAACCTQRLPAPSNAIGVVAAPLLGMGQASVGFGAPLAASSAALYAHIPSTQRPSGLP